jgi:hypothetical protein
MQELCLISRKKFVFGLLVAFGLAIMAPPSWAQQAGSNSAQAAWASVQHHVKAMETAVQSKNLGGIHDPTMKIRAPIKTLKGHSSMLSGDKGQKVSAALKQLDTSVTDLHSASDEGNQAKAEAALKSVESAFDQLKAEDPETAFKGM